MYVEYDINIISLVILAVVLLSNIRNGGGSKFRQQFFRALIVCNMLLLAVGIAVPVLSGRPGPAVHAALAALLSLRAFLCVLFGMFWALFCTLRRGRRLKRRGYLMLSLPALAAAAWLVAAGDMVHSITDGNTYVRGAYFYMPGAAAHLYVLCALFVVWRSKKSMDRREYWLHLLMPLFPAALAAAQLVFAHGMVWPGVAVCLLAMQIYALNEKMSLDHLTGLYNRKYLDDYVEDLLHIGRSGDRRFAALMLDIDNFKKINDAYGHVEGDKAIVAAAALLKKSVRKGDFVSRYGGDEFLIILDECGPRTPARVINRLRDNVARYNNENDLPYRIDFSIGYKIFSSVRGLTAKDIFSRIDGLMYQHKQSKIFDEGGNLEA